MILEFTKNLDFNQIICSNDLVLFDFKMENCARCESLLNQIKDYLIHNDIKVYIVDVKDNMKLVRKLNIYASPCLLLYKNKELVHRNLGTFNFEEFIKYM